MEFGDFGLRLLRRHRIPQRLELAHFEQIETGAEHAGHAREIRVDVQHAAIVMSQHTHPVVAQGCRHPRRFDPPADTSPRLGLFQIARHDVVAQPQPIEHAGHFGHRAGLTVSQPLAGHASPVAQRIECVVVDGSRRLQIQHDDRPARPLHDGQHRRRERISRYIKEDQLHAPLFEQTCRPLGLAGFVHHARIDHFRTEPLHSLGDAPAISVEAGEQPVELSPIGVEPDTEQAYFHFFHIVCLLFDSGYVANEPPRKVRMLRRTSTRRPSGTVLLQRYDVSGKYESSLSKDRSRQHGSDDVECPDKVGTNKHTNN